MSAATAPRLESLERIEARCWDELERAATDRAHEWRVQALATQGVERAEVRSLVLRDLMRAEKALVFYTDARSPKARQLRAHPLASLLAWSPAMAWQLRLAVRLEVKTSGLDRASRWARVKLARQAMDYLAAVPPGTPIETFEAGRGSREHFAVVTATVQHIDWLELHADGHRRARFEGESRVWLAP